MKPDLIDGTVNAGVQAAAAALPPEKWEVQRQRLGRWLDRLRQMNDGTVCEHRDTKHLEDDARAFFVECYHLGDYFWKSSPPLCSDDDVFTWRKEHSALETCRELCNGFKHVRRGVAFGQKSVLLTINDCVGAEPDPSTHGLRLRLEPNGEDALQIAEQAVADWDELIARCH